LLTLASATRAQSPEDVDGRQEGAVAVRALAPERGFVTGGLRVVVHGAGFTDALACQFGPHVVAPVSIHEDGTRMLCVAPPFANQLGGFVRVGVAIRVGGDGAARRADVRVRGDSECGKRFSKTHRRLGGRNLVYNRA
jgi:hypothetical protein